MIYITSPEVLPNMAAATVLRASLHDGPSQASEQLAFQALASAAATTNRQNLQQKIKEICQGRLFQAGTGARGLRRVGPEHPVCKITAPLAPTTTFCPAQLLAPNYSRDALLPHRE